MLRGASTFQAIEEERLSNLKAVLNSYLHHSNDLGPRLIEVGILFLFCLKEYWNIKYVTSDNLFLFL